jgi:serine/threonine protein kinase
MAKVERIEHADHYDAWLRDPGDYEHVRDIGSGKLGLVALVRDKRTGEELARREVREAVAAPGAKPADKTFMQEIEFFMRVRPHPAICTFHGWWFVSPRAVLLQYLPNGCLHTILASSVDKRPAWFDGTVKAKVIFGFAAAMMHLHAHGAIHRYLTPRNIMFDEAHEPRLVDFGYAKVNLDSAQFSQVTGGDNGAYVSPEATANLPCDQSMDVFAFALILNYLLTNQRPYAGLPTAFRVAREIREGVRPAIPDACHRSFKQIMQAGWDAAPDKRPSFAEIVSHLLLIDEPLFPGVDMAQYRAYRDRIMQASMRLPEDEGLFHLKADLKPASVAEFNAVQAAAERNDPEAVVRLRTGPRNS